MIRGSHRSGKIAQHTCCVDDTWYVSIDEHEIETELGMSVQQSFLFAYFYYMSLAAPA